MSQRLGPSVFHGLTHRFPSPSSLLQGNEPNLGRGWSWALLSPAGFLIPTSKDVILKRDIQDLRVLLGPTESLRTETLHEFFSARTHSGLQLPPRCPFSCPP